MSLTGTYLDAIDDDGVDYEAADVVENDAVYRGPTERTAVPFPSAPPAGYESWDSFMTSVKQPYRDRDDAAAVADEPIEVLEQGEATPADTGPAPRKVAAAAAGMGWDVWVHFSRVRRPAVLYKHDGDGHNRGDVLYAEKRYTVWTVTAKHPGAALGFRATWVEGVTPKGGRSFGFDSAICRDPAGVPIELYCDYTPDALSLKQQKMEPNEAWMRRVDDLKRLAAEQDRTYNDDSDYLERRPLYAKSKEFDMWLADWVSLTTPTEGAS